MKALSAVIPKIEKILISVVKILWGGGKRFFFGGAYNFLRVGDIVLKLMSY